MYNRNHRLVSAFLGLTSMCDLDDEIEYEFPIYNQTETLEGLWERNDTRYNSENAQYGGLRLYTPPKTYYLLKFVFPHIQIDLRRATLANYNSNNDGETDLYQWYFGSKLCNGDVESLMTLEIDEQSNHYIEIKVRGPSNASKACFCFMDQLLEIVFTAIEKICPSLLIEKHLLSPRDLRSHTADPYCYEPQLIFTSMLEAESTLDIALLNPNLNVYEDILQLLTFGDNEITSMIDWGCSLRVQELPNAVKLRLCGFLDPPDPHGRDWCLLALRLGLCQQKIAALDSQHSSHTMRLLATADCSIGALATCLMELDRLDAADILQRSCPFYKIRKISDFHLNTVGEVQH